MNSLIKLKPKIEYHNILYILADSFVIYGKFGNLANGIITIIQNHVNKRIPRILWRNSLKSAALMIVFRDQAEKTLNFKRHEPLI